MEATSKIQIKRIHFSQKEDEALKLLVQKYGESEWGIIAAEMPNRSIRQCRERWQNHLKATVQKGKWSHEEDELLKLKYTELGPKWKLMESFFPGRTAINIRNRFSCLRRFLEIYRQNNNYYIQYQAHNKTNNIQSLGNLSPISSPPNTFNVINIQKENISEPQKQNDIRSSFEEEQTEFWDQTEGSLFDVDFGIEFFYECN
ncbi:Myb-like DNA-binding domain containing protein [Histomonas meleagridis]|uniref:Myb-like DNA-binding domain containing protein n=1 Tax=Histomonas meleagridis TaxID=135588 RepID=UPI0035598E69|nr:Myb-like DNA-binding domain containing protein [Histomonas meleagridis]KAH0797648.1 Myb-like DNA-binding domain containing protein [Histomonas meleagridis]